MVVRDEEIYKSIVLCYINDSKCGTVVYRKRIYNV